MLRGKGKSKGRRCPKCKGTGRRLVVRMCPNALLGINVSGGRCDYCGGTGRIER